MQIVYEPKGAALEYSELACNLYKTCVHGCKYCFAPAILRLERPDFHQPGPMKVDALKKLERDCMKLGAAHDKRRILFSFVTDPAQSMEVAYVHNRALHIAAAFGMATTILTKGGLMATVMFEQMANWGDVTFGQTVSFSAENDATRRLWEPRAAPIIERYRAFQAAKSMGIPTWLSLEPVIDPEDAIHVIRQFAPVVDKWKIGKWGHDARAKDIDWRKFCAKATILLDELKADYVFKKDLQEYLP